ncbi:hypothetical protein ADUPG1_009713 [Aduncisulcus paluster]|uniref:Uncharacterized protein n=1 Tax=Aduncisulcus paluster TaxID=2918883 RepID=A0ABQ5KWI1_9EUKA|nr:hypothetical protein ADUPG1_009713 [Aduncisulcus paluster]
MSYKFERHRCLSLKRSTPIMVQTSTDDETMPTLYIKGYVKEIVMGDKIIAIHKLPYTFLSLDYAEEDFICDDPWFELPSRYKYVKEIRDIEPSYDFYCGDECDNRWVEYFDLPDYLKEIPIFKKKYGGESLRYEIYCKICLYRKHDRYYAKGYIKESYAGWDDWCHYTRLPLTRVPYIKRK